MLLLFLLSTAPAEAAADAALDWSRDFYGRGPFCGTAKVTDVRRAAADIEVRLDIDPRWSESLAELPAPRRERWFALHCPFVADKIWSLRNLRDVVIVGEAPYLEHI